MKSKKINSLTWGLFNCRFPHGWGKDFVIMLKRIPFVIRHGYYPQAYFESYLYFIDMWKEIFTWYRDSRNGTPMPLDTPEHEMAEIEDRYTADMDTMIHLLDKMAIDPLDYPDDLETAEKLQYATMNCFFEMFKDKFYGLWD